MGCRENTKIRRNEGRQWVKKGDIAIHEVGKKSEVKWLTIATEVKDENKLVSNFNSTTNVQPCVYVLYAYPILTLYLEVTTIEVSTQNNKYTEQSKT